MRGVLIAFEGIEGSGKTTQANLLYSFLKEKSLPCIFTREPGGTEIGERIREILLDVKHKDMHPKTELLLYLASRAQHTYEKILPELQKGTIIITDRYALSSMAYQGGARELTFKLVSRFNKFATANLKPDLTILVDVPVNVGLERMGKRNLDRLEQEKIEFHEKIRNAYLKLAKKAPKKIWVFSGIKPETELHQEIKEKVLSFLTKRGIKIL
ncbi:MAG: dTMP kinase [candidate division WOR-3 bacterium]|nr:dTMP kinase [candidate division WOR-3 bacterium]